LDIDDQIQLRSQYSRSNLSNFNLESKEDYLNFSIEKIWQEMEEIGRSKKAA